MFALSGLVPGVWRDFRRGFAHFLAYDLCFKVLGSAVVAPIAGGTVRNLNPSLRIGYMIYGARGAIARLEVDFLSLSERLVSGRLVSSIQRTGREVHVWTVDDPRRMSSLIDLGVDNITTNAPARLRALIDERAVLSDAEKLLLAFGTWLRN